MIKKKVDGGIVLKGDAKELGEEIYRFLVGEREYRRNGS